MYALKGRVHVLTIRKNGTNYILNNINELTFLCVKSGDNEYVIGIYYPFICFTSEIT
jgi:hypothetical protein